MDKVPIKKCFAALLASIAFGCNGMCSAAVVIQYHHISENTPKATSTSPALFKQHMDYLANNDFTIVPLEELTALLTAGKTLPDKTVAITFDDAYDSVYSEAFPILKKRSWPFTVFVNAKPLEQGNKQFVTWEQLREMTAAGATIANHSWSHPHFLRRLENEDDKDWQQRMKNEIELTQQKIQQEIKQDHRILAYPYGEFDNATKALMKQMGYVAFGQQSGPLNAIDDLQALPRFPFGGVYGEIDDFASKVQSLPLPLTSAPTFSDENNRQLTEVLLPQNVAQPQLQLNVKDAAIAKRIQCYASGQGAIGVRVEGNIVVAQANRALPVARSRYNCTAPSEQRGRYYWYSQIFIKKQANGDWYPEP